jgi:hypothetical protein
MAIQQGEKFLPALSSGSWGHAAKRADVNPSPLKIEKDSNVITARSMPLYGSFFCFHVSWIAI